MPSCVGVEENLYDPDAVYIYDSLDPGHRHFSLMHWLYPNTFHFATEGNQRLYVEAAKKTLDHKRLNDGGHTSWSAAWEACLYARLGDGHSSLQAINRILTKFMTANMLSLHPALFPFEEDTCRTCFRWIHDPSSSGVDEIPSFARGMVTASDSKVCRAL